jgi:hypothetical protein
MDADTLQRVNQATKHCFDAVARSEKPFVALADRLSELYNTPGWRSEEVYEVGRAVVAMLGRIQAGH